MASIRKRQNGTYEVKFQRKGLLPAPVYFTFDHLDEAQSYEERTEALLDRGVVPVEFTGTPLKTLGDLCQHFEAMATYSKSDGELIGQLQRAVQGVAMARLTYAWVEDWVDSMKASLKPSTLIKRVGLLARVVDWAMRRDMITIGNNPLRLLPRGYATKGVDRNLRWNGERDRRLEGDEEARIRAVLKPEEDLLFTMALETGMRMMEMVTLSASQIDRSQRTIFLDKTKNGDKRQVPISSVLYAALEGISGEHVFSWGAVPIDKARNRLSHLFAYRFEAAGCPDLRFHDLRREATCRLYERTTMTDMEISTITGHKDLRMLKRYANLRGSTLASKMW